MNQRDMTQYDRKVFKRRRSDLTGDYPPYPAILLQPEYTRGMSLQLVRNLDPHDYQRIIEETMLLRGLRHVATLTYQSRREDGVPAGILCVEECGGKVQLDFVSKGHDGDKLRDKTQFILTCAGSDECGMKVWPKDRELIALQSDILHLMLKQAAPLCQLGFNSCNFADCNEKDDPELKALGTVSLACDSLDGHLNYGQYRDFDHRFTNPSLAFILAPGMNMVDGADGFENWIDVLERRMRGHQIKSLNLLGRLQFGPKPLR